MTKNNKLTPSAFRLFITVLILPIVSSAIAQDSGITLNWKDADIRIVVEAVSEATGKNFILDPRVTGKVNLLSAEPTRLVAAMRFRVDRLGIRRLRTTPRMGVR